MTKRPLLFIIIAYVLGIVVGIYLKINLMIIPSIFLAVLSLFKIKDRHKLIIIIIIILFCNFGVGYSNYKYNYRSVVSSYEDKEIEINGTFLYVMSKKETYSRAVVSISKVNGQKINQEKVAVNCNNNKTLSQLSYGDLVKISGRVAVPNEERNPGGFNYKRYLLTKNIYSIIDAENINLQIKGGGNYSRVVKLSLAIRNRFENVISKSLPQPQAGLMEGIVLSKTENIDDQIKSDFRTSGLSHLMAVSGINVGILIMVMNIITKALKLKKYITLPLITFLLIIFALMTGATPSIVRAVIMGIVVIYAEVFSRKNDILTAIGFSCILMLFYNPMFVFDIGFQLSYMATIGIVLLYSKIKSILGVFPEYFKDAMAVTLSAQVGVLPILAYNFNNVSLISPISNLLAATLSSVILISGLCMTILGQIHISLAYFLAGTNYWLLTLLLVITQKSASIPYSSIIVSTPNIYIILIYYLATCGVPFYWSNVKALISNKLFVRISLSIISMILILVMFQNKPLRISYIDVGQGDAIYISTSNGKNILLDCGGNYSSEYNSGDKTIVPFLLDKGIKNIDIIMLSHTDIDHINGLDSVINQFNVKSLVISSNISTKQNMIKKLETYRTNGTKIVYISHLGKIQIGKDTFFQAYSAEGQYSNSNDKESLVYRLTYKSKNFLFAGDISVAVEKELINKYKLNADVLKIAHHGSFGSTSNEFLENIKPSIAVISVGKNNLYGHPSEEVIERLQTNKIKVFRTDTNGCVSVYSNGTDIKVITMNGEKIKI